MLGDVVEAALAVGRVVVVTDDAAVVPPGVEIVPDPGAGLGAAVAAGLVRVEGHALVVNADLPAVTPEALLRLAGRPALALVEAPDGTTNALSLPDPTLVRAAVRAGERGSLSRACAVRDGLDPGARGRRRLGRRSRASRRATRPAHARTSRRSRVRVVLLSGGGGGARFARGCRASSSRAS